MTAINGGIIGVSGMHIATSHRPCVHMRLRHLPILGRGAVCSMRMIQFAPPTSRVDDGADILCVQLKPLALTAPPPRGHVKVALPLPTYPAAQDRAHVLPPTKVLLAHADELAFAWRLLTEHLPN